MPQFASRAGWHRGHLNLYVPLALTASAVEYVTDLVPGFRFTVESVKAYVVVPGTNAGATRLLRVIKGASTVVASGTETLANTATAGTGLTLTNGTADALEFGDADTLTVDYPASGTAFTAGTVNLVIQYLQRPQQR